MNVLTGSDEGVSGEEEELEGLLLGDLIFLNGGEGVGINEGVSGWEKNYHRKVFFHFASAAAFLLSRVFRGELNLSSFKKPLDANKFLRTINPIEFTIHIINVHTNFLSYITMSIRYIILQPSPFSLRSQSRAIIIRDRFSQRGPISAPFL